MINPEITPQSEDRNIITEIFVWNGITIAVGYEPLWLAFRGEPPGEFDMAHIEVRVVEPRSAPIPITETGYLSHFTGIGVVEEAGGPIAFVKAALDEKANSKSWRAAQAKWQQQDLFA